MRCRSSREAPGKVHGKPLPRTARAAFAAQPSRQRRQQLALLHTLLCDLCAPRPAGMGSGAGGHR